MLRKRIFALLSLLCLLCGCAAQPQSGEAAPAVSAETAAQTTAAPAAEPLSDESELLRRVTVLRYDSAQIWLNGEPQQLSTPTFLSGGVLYVPIADLAVLLGDSFVRSGDVYMLNHAGNVTILMPDYNVILVNKTAYVMHSTPLVRDGRICVPAEGLTKALQCAVSKEPSLGICVLEHEPQRLERRQLRGLCQTLGLPLADARQDPLLLALAEQYGCEYDRLERLAAEERLWQSDAAGVASQVTLDDTGAPVLRRYETCEPYAPDELFFSQPEAGGVLRRLRDEKTVGQPPDVRYAEELRAATRRFMELKAAVDLNDDETAAALRPAYLTAVMDGVWTDTCRKDLEDPYETSLFTEENRENGWDTLYAAARAGDILLFSAEGAGAAYGCFNHCALILERTGNGLHLLHARGAEYGVGSDLEMDWLTESAFSEVEYWKNYGMVYLCRVGGLTEAQTKTLTHNANERFNGAQFGYGGRLGLDEVNCTELVDESFLDAGVDLIDGDYDTRLKEVLKGNTSNLVPVPDDLLFSEQVRVLAVWKR